jgi:alpha-tubulin suppressor-like RCC1 family protein
MNTTINSMPKRVAVRGILLVACIAYLTMQAATPARSAAAPGTVTAWGYNSSGELGDGTTTSSSTPVTVLLPPGVTASAIAAGFFHNLAITSDGVYTWGGIIIPARVSFPEAVTTVTAVAAGGGHSLAITNDGLYAWGANQNGQLGDGTTANATTPVRVVFPLSVTQVSAIAAGYGHSLAITDDGLYAWGLNSGGQLGIGTRTPSSVPVKVAFPAGVMVTAISGGGFHSLAITNDGVYAWGNNTFGQIGDGTITDSTVPRKITFPKKVALVSAVAAGFWHSLGITDNGAYAWGYNNGELGDGTFTDRHTPVKVTFPKAVTAVTAIAAGSMHSLAVTNDGLYAWGVNSIGQLGISSNVSPVPTPTRVKGESNAIAVGAGYYHSLALH